MRTKKVRDAKYISDVVFTYSRLDVVYIGAGCAKLSGLENVWLTTGLDELYLACQPIVSFTKGHQCRWFFHN